MKEIMRKNINATRMFYIFVLAHLLWWTLIQVLSRHTVNHDTVEAFNWGNSLAFGYDKNPYLTGWVAYLAMALCNYAKNAWGYYFIQQLFIASGLIGLWQFSKLLYDEKKALFSVMIMEGSLYLGAYTQTNNDNYILIGLFPWIALFFSGLTH